MISSKLSFGEFFLKSFLELVKQIAQKFPEILLLKFLPLQIPSRVYLLIFSGSPNPRGSTRSFPEFLEKLLLEFFQEFFQKFFLRFQRFLLVLFTSICFPLLGFLHRIITGITEFLHGVFPEIPRIFQQFPQNSTRILLKISPGIIPDISSIIHPELLTGTIPGVSLGNLQQILSGILT